VFPVSATVGLLLKWAVLPNRWPPGFSVLISIVSIASVSAMNGIISVGL